MRKARLLLAMGAVFGFGSEFFCAGSFARAHANERRERFEEHVAKLCVGAAQNTR
jgi:hypothetical protein